MSRVTHFEIHASQPDTLIAFYTQLFGWSFEPYGPPGFYWLIRTGSKDEPGIDGGLVPRRGDAPTDGMPVSAYVCTTGVENVHESLATALANGGTLALAVDVIPGVGWLCYAKDPDGNIFGMIQNDANAK